MPYSAPKLKFWLFAGLLSLLILLICLPFLADTAGPKPSSIASAIVRDSISGQFTWEVDGSPFYLKAVVYEPGKNVSAKQLRKDFALIQIMGANALVCQGEITSPVLQAAAANELKVIARLPLDSSGLTAVRQFQQNALLALSFFPTDIPPEKASAVLAEIRQTAPNIPIILEWPQTAIPDHLLLLVDMVGSPAHAASKPFLAIDLGKATRWDTIAYGMSWPLRYPEMSCYEKARSYAQLWKKLEETQGYNLGGAIYRWSDRQTENGALPGITDHKGRLKPAYYALQEMWTGASQRFPLQDVILKTDHIFHNGENFFQISALSPFDPEQDATYEWYLGSDNAHETPVLVANDSNENSFLVKVRRKFREKTGMSCYTLQQGSIFRIRQDHTRLNQRIYLHISDNDNHVVTASMPIDPNHFIQRIPWQ